MSPTRSLVVPIYNNREFISRLLDRIDGLIEELGPIEAVFIVDGSPDDSHEILLRELPTRAFASQLIAHSRNFGSFAAVRTGLDAATGDHIAVMAADLQEPPELIVELFEALGSGDTDIAFGIRTGRSDPLFSRIASRLFWGVYRRLVVRDMPRGGVDIFAVTRQVSQTVLSLPGTNTSLVAQLFWVGYRRTFIPYQRLERATGRSGWSVRNRLRYMADSVLSFTDLPIITMLWLGLIGLGGAFILAVVTVTARLLGAIEEPGFATLILVTLGSFGILLTSQAVLGMYLWRAFDNTQGRPSAIVRDSRTWPTDSGADDER